MAESMTNKTATKICEMCNENVSKYCCPRCDILYCSLTCYKSDKHITCSEEFYKECITEELSMFQDNHDSKHKMIDILKRIQNNDDDLEDLFTNQGSDSDAVDSDDDDGGDLHERIKNLDLNNSEQIWSVLTDDEKNEFDAILRQGDVGSIIPQWVPWWSYHKDEKLVEDVNHKKKEEQDALDKCPTLKDVPKFSSLISVEPSISIKYNIANVLASYVFLARYFNGELEPVEMSTYFLNICANLDANANFDNLRTSTESVAQRCLQSDIIETDTLSLEVMKHDTFLIIQGPSKDNKEYYCKAALSHLHAIFTEAKSKTKSSNKTETTGTKVNGIFSKRFPEHDGKHLSKLDISKVKKCIKKIEYYLSYVEDRSMPIK